MTAFQQFTVSHLVIQTLQSSNETTLSARPHRFCNITSISGKICLQVFLLLRGDLWARAFHRTQAMFFRSHRFVHSLFYNIRHFLCGCNAYMADNVIEFRYLSFRGCQCRATWIKACTTHSSPGPGSIIYTLIRNLAWNGDKGSFTHFSTFASKESSQKNEKYWKLFLCSHLANRKMTMAHFVQLLVQAASENCWNE